MTYNYKCTLCNTLFPYKQAYLVHVPKCTQKHGRRPSYRLLKETLFDGIENALKDGNKLPNRFQTNVREWIYKYLATRDGEKCLLCGAAPGREPLEIDHADGNEINDAADNLHLLCKPCNLRLRKLSPKEHARLMHDHSAINVCEREREHGDLATELAKQHIDYSEGPTTMQAAGYFEVKFRRFALEEVARVGVIPKADLIYSGAEVCGCSPISAERYLSKLVSSAGALKVIRGTSNELLVTHRGPMPAKPLSKLIQEQLTDIIGPADRPKELKE
jgi:hypothetical protein